MASIRTAESRWDGTLNEGKGIMKAGSGAFEGPYSFASRFEEGAGTNPEEMIGAALSGCFSMFVSALLSKEGIEPKSIKTTAKVHLDKVDGAPRVTRIELETEGEVPGIDDATFQEKTKAAKEGCPISNALAGPEITLTARLIQG